MRHDLDRDMDGSIDLTDAIENAYRVFSGYRLGGALEVCRCPACISDETAQQLERTPLRQIPAALLAKYTHSGHVFDAAIARQYRYFLPRCFELIAAGDPPSHSMESCLSRLSYANYSTDWPEDEAGAIDRVFVALLRDVLARPVEFGDGQMPTAERDRAEQLLCMAAKAGAEIGTMLAVWDATASRDADIRMANMIASVSRHKKWPERLANPFWYGAPHVERQAAILVQWIARSETRARLEVRCLAEADHELAGLLSAAEEIVARL
jgi:hypothetical protein